MTINNKRRHPTEKQVRLILLLILGLFISSFKYAGELSATGNPITDTGTAIAGLELRPSPAPSALKDFVQLTIDKLAKQAPFKSWKEGNNEYYPLGPGTHSWLVNVMNGNQRIGYLIITAKEEGGYVLSEYGAGTEGLPYSVCDLRQLLVQEGLLPSSYSEVLTLTPIYSPLLPVWELSIGAQKLYINASVPEILPWNSNKAEAFLKKELTVANYLSSSDSALVPQAAYRSGQSSDPYADLLWLTKPKLDRLSVNEFSALLRQKGRFIFHSSGHNDTFGSPQAITGYQKWTTTRDTAEAKGSMSKLYAAAGPQGKRFVPYRELLENGTLHESSMNK